MKDNEFNIVLGIILIIIFIIGSTMIYERQKQKELELRFDQDVSITSSPTFLISNCSIKQYGIELEVNENMTKEQRQGYIFGILTAMVFDYPRNETLPFLTINIGSEECNNSYSKEYWDISDFTGEDDCVEEGLCFIKYVDNQKKYG